MFDNIIDKIKKVDGEEKYWLFRAGTKAKYFDNFFYSRKIGLAWDKIDDISQTSSLLTLTNEVKRLYPEEKRPGNIYNKIYSFIHEMKNGDFIVMPDTEKKRIAIGRLTDDNVEIKKIEEQLSLMPIKSHENYDEEEKTDPGVINKYRNIEWIKVMIKEELTAELELFLFAPHSISELSKSAQYEINKLIYDCFINQDNIYLKYKVDTRTDILADDILMFYKLIDYSEKLSNILEEEPRKIKTKINVASPGDIVAIGGVSIGLILALGYVFNGGKISIKIGEKFNFDAEGGTPLQEFFSNRHKNKMEKMKFKARLEELEELERKFNNEITHEEIKKMKKSLELKTPKIIEEQKEKED